MNAWSPLTAQEVLNQFNDSETSAYDSAKGDPGLVSLADIINKVTDQIAQAYADAGRLYDPATASTPPAGVIPPGEKNRAIALVRWLYLLALPSGRALAEYRAAEAGRAADYFVLVARRQIPFAAVAVARPGRYLRPDSFDALGHT
jgi:hypothetical protein